MFCQRLLQEVNLLGNILRDQFSTYYINGGLFFGIGITYMLNEQPGMIYLMIAALGGLQLFLLLSSWMNTNHQDWPLDQFEAVDEISINISLWNLFKAFKSSLVLILIYLFYSIVMMHYEINHRFSLQNSSLNFVSIPPIYMFITLFLDILLKRFKNLNILTIILLFVQIIFAVMDVMLRLYKVNDVFSFLVFAINMVLFQKLVFVHINITLLKIFDISNLRVRNYLNCKFISDDQYNSILRKLNRVWILSAFKKQ